ncbi:4474_t:CDS:10 [Entrophospora sp. SA101]|nr:4474_t:CDS:10 [Entrophospora sp. SA101]
MSLFNLFDYSIEEITNSSNIIDNDDDDSENGEFNSGKRLLNSGEFGCAKIGPSHEKTLNGIKLFSKNICSQLLLRELVPREISNLPFRKKFIPNTNGKVILRYAEPAYSGQYSQDGSLFYSCSKDFRVRIYDTNDPQDPKEIKVISGEEFGRWTITDANLSNDNKWIAYSSITPSVCLAKTDVEEDYQTILDFDNGELYAASNDIVKLVNDNIYDIERKEVILEIDGHKDHVNAVCFADDSSHVLFSGSDDSLIKVWDRRSMHNEKECGVLVGHTEGLTYVSSKGDGRYCLSNGKDQKMKLWDIRKMMSGDQYKRLPPVNLRRRKWDYRHMRYPGDIYFEHPQNVSVMTYRGHSVLRTLIRCHFSPASTGHSYLYTGSEDGCIRVSTKKQKNYYNYFYNGRNELLLYRPVTRDASWHPYLPIISSTNWSGSNLTLGTIDEKVEEMLY